MQPHQSLAEQHQRQVNGSASYYEYTAAAAGHAPQSSTSRVTAAIDTTTNVFTNIRDTAGYPVGRNHATEVQLAGPLTSQMTPVCTNTTPALVAQALSGM